jgi:poly-gamma-glutamate synthesis protein (capsule biosynthesis protein)
MADRTRVTLFLCGDVMTGRGVDQILPRPSAPRLYERFLTSALDYVALAEHAHGLIPRRVEPAYVWGVLPEVLDRERPDVRIVNLETSVTTSDAAAPKGINYRMHPANVAVLTAAGIDCCVLANNHVLDWGPAGLLETVATLARAGIRVVGAGHDLAAARAPGVLEIAPGHRVLVLGLGTRDSGIPRHWAAGAATPGVHLLPDLSETTADDVARLVDDARRPGDVIVASVHWGPNWGYDVPPAHRRFTRALIDRARVDVVHGHSSHHPMAIEVHRGHPILYGCGDFLNDYEGIGGHDAYRSDLALAYFVTVDACTGELARLTMTPLQIRNFRLRYPAPADRAWVHGRLDRECRRFGHRVVPRDGALVLESA